MATKAITYAQGHPLQGENQTCSSYRADLAKWMGCDSVADYERCHDPLHAEMNQWMGCTSYALLAAQGVKLSPALLEIAELEAVAVLHAQRWMQALRNAEEDIWLEF